MSLILFCILAASLAPQTASASPTVTTEQATDRPGSDYSSYELATSDPALCRAACEADDECKAYTWVMPGVQEGKSVCYLKDSAPAPQQNSCCVSGVKLEGRSAAPNGLDADMKQLAQTNADVATSACDFDLKFLAPQAPTLESTSMNLAIGDQVRITCRYAVVSRHVSLPSCDNQARRTADTMRSSGTATNRVLSGIVAVDGQFIGVSSIPAGSENYVRTAIWSFKEAGSHTVSCQVDNPLGSYLRGADPYLAEALSLQVGTVSGAGRPVGFDPAKARLLPTQRVAPTTDLLPRADSGGVSGRGRAVYQSPDEDEVPSPPDPGRGESSSVSRVGQPIRTTNALPSNSEVIASANTQLPTTGRPAPEKKSSGKNQLPTSAPSDAKVGASAKAQAAMDCALNPLSCCPANQTVTEGCEAVTKALLDVRFRSYVPPRFTVMGKNSPFGGDVHLDNIVSDVTVNGPFKVWPGCRFNVTEANHAIEDSKSILQKGAELAEAWLHQWSSGIESAKNYVAAGVADKVCGAVYDSDSCRSKVAGVVKAGINLGLSSLGIPPELPDIQELRAHGVEYIASQAASYALGELDAMGKLPLDDELRQALYDEAYNKAVEEVSKELNKVLPPTNFSSEKPQTWGHLEPAYAPHNAHIYVEVRIRLGMYPTYLQFIAAKPGHEWPPLYLHDLNGIYASRGPVEIPRFIPENGLILPFTLLPKEFAYTAADTAPTQIPGEKISLTWLKNDFGLSLEGLVRQQLNFMHESQPNWNFWSDWDLGYAASKSAKFRLLSPAYSVLDWEAGWEVPVGVPRDPSSPYPPPTSKLSEKVLYDYYGRIDPAPRCNGEPNIIFSE